jgi:hypothetical protein
VFGEDGWEATVARRLLVPSPASSRTLWGLVASPCQLGLTDLLAVRTDALTRETGARHGQRWDLCWYSPLRAGEFCSCLSQADRKGSLWLKI